MYNLTIPSKSAAIVLLDSIILALDNKEEMELSVGDQEDLKNLRDDLRKQIKKGGDS